MARESRTIVSLMVLPLFEVFCDLLLNKHTATWNLYVLYLAKQKRNIDKLASF